MVSDRRLSFAVASSLFVITVAASIRPPLLPEIGRDLQLSSLGLGAMGSVFALGRLAADLPAGRMSDRIPAPRMMLIGVVVFAASGSVLGLWISVMCVSLGSVSVNVGTTPLADLSEGGRLGPRLGAFRFTGDGAFLIAPVLAGWLLGTQGRFAAMLPLVALTAIVLIGCVLWVPETPHRARAESA